MMNALDVLKTVRRLWAIDRVADLQAAEPDAAAETITRLDVEIDQLCTAELD
jgi:hypothetical protein